MATASRRVFKERLSTLSIRQLVRGMDPGRITRSKAQIKGLRITGVRQPANRKFNKSKNINDLDHSKPATFIFQVRSINNTYEVKIKFQREISSTSPAKVGCTCPDYLYRLAYVLWHANASLGAIPEIAKTRAPKVTNPKEKKFICKHISGAIRGLINARILRR